MLVLGWELCCDYGEKSQAMFDYGYVFAAGVAYEERRVGGGRGVLGVCVLREETRKGGGGKKREKRGKKEREK